MRAKEAKKILPKNEYEAFESILLNQISRMGASTLMQKATLSRKLRDKYRALSRHQVIETRTRRTNEVDTDLNDRKARIFQELMSQIEDELAEKKSKDKEFPEVPRRKKKAKKASSHFVSREDRQSILEARRRTRPTS